MQRADRLYGRFALGGGSLAPAVDACLTDFMARDVVDKLYARETGLWTEDPALAVPILRVFTASQTGWSVVPLDVVGERFALA